MKTRLILCGVLGLSVLSLFFISCKKDEKSYPYTIEYHRLIFGATHWFVLTADLWTGIDQPSSMTGFDDTLKTTLLSEDLLPPFRRLEFLSDSTVKVRFTDSGVTFDTIIPYNIYQGMTRIPFGPSPEETVVLYNGLEQNTLVLGVVVTMYSNKQPNGAVIYSPVDILYSEELNVFKIIKDLRATNHLMLNDTVAVNKPGYLFD